MISNHISLSLRARPPGPRTRPAAAPRRTAAPHPPPASCAAAAAAGPSRAGCAHGAHCAARDRAGPGDPPGRASLTRVLADTDRRGRAARRPRAAHSSAVQDGGGRAGDIRHRRKKAENRRERRKEAIKEAKTRIARCCYVDNLREDIVLVVNLNCLLFFVPPG